MSKGISYCYDDMIPMPESDDDVLVYTICCT